MSPRHFLYAALLLPLLATSQTFTTSGGAIPDDGTAVEFPIAVSGLAPSTIDTSMFGLETVCVDIAHSWVSDLEIRIVAPDGTNALLFGGLGGDTDFFTNTCLNPAVPEAITDAAPPFTGTFKPQGPMGLVNNGQGGDGIWKLRIYDTYAFADAGDLLSASITFGNDPAGYYSITESDLPIVVINTGGQQIVNEPKIMAAMGIIDNGPGSLNHTNDPFNGYQNHIGIEVRGNSSTMFQKRSYGFELWDTNGEEIDEPLLGMPTESDWVLSANHSDKSLLNNPLTFDLAQRAGHYAPRWRHVAVILDGAYIGTYVLMEKIKRDGDRVDIAKLQPQDTLGDELTGGYIIKLDWAQGSNSAGWTSPFPPPGGNGQVTEFLVDHPNEPSPLQTAYIQAYVDSFETALDGPDFTDPVIGYRHFLDERSAIDFFLINELGRNVDGYRLSTFLHKDRDSHGGRLVLGPMWDFDLAFRNANYCDGSVVEGWAYQFASVCPDDGKLPPFWWERLMQDAAFTDSLRCRWEDLRGNVFSPVRLDAWCDSMAGHLALGAQQNFTQWPILGHWVWPNPWPLPDSYLGEVAELKNWINARWQWLDDHIPGQCTHTGTPDLEGHFRLVPYPNPFTDRLEVILPDHMTVSRCAFIDMLGAEQPAEWSTSRAGTRLLVSSPQLPPGAYVLRIVTSSGTMNVPLVRAAP